MLWDARIGHCMVTDPFHLNSDTMHYVLICNIDIFNLRSCGMFPYKVSYTSIIRYNRV